MIFDEARATDESALITAQAQIGALSISTKPAPASMPVGNWRPITATTITAKEDAFAAARARGKAREEAAAKAAGLGTFPLIPIIVGAVVLGAISIVVIRRL